MTNYDEIRKLLGGYSTGTLTEEENRKLMAAAMEDQRIFDALADEEALRELLSDDAFRQELVEELREEPGLWTRLVAWWSRPMPLALAGGAAAVAVALVIAVPLWRADRPVDMAMQREAPEQVLKDELAKSRTGAQSISRKEVASEEASASTPPPAPSAAAPSVDYMKPIEPPSGGGGSIAPPPVSEAQVQSRQRLAEAEAPAELAAAPDRAPVKRRGERTDRAKAGAEGAGPQSALTSFRAEQAEVADVAASAPAAAAAPLQVRLERQESDGDFESLAAGVSVQKQDTLRLRIDAPAPGYVSVLASSDASSWEVVAETQVSGLRPAYVPTEGGLPRPEAAGARYYRVRYSTTGPRSEADEEMLRAAARSVTAPIETQVLVVYQD
jgi:hypothetical protein